MMNQSILVDRVDGIGLTRMGEFAIDCLNLIT